MQVTLLMLSFIPLSLSLYYLYVPVFFNLQLSSAYEYLEMRFSKGTRIFVSLLAVFHLTVYMAIVVLGPSLALQQVAGIDTKLSTGAIFVVCIFYSSIGLVDEGGLSAVWERAANTNRTEFLSFDTDPRTRHTVWTAIIGGYFYWLPMYAATQAQVQRYLSLPSLSSARKAVVINTGCDPLKAKTITNSDQLLPLYVMGSSGDIPGLPGLFVAGLTCASLSTVSSGLSALASILTYDYIQKGFPNLSDEKLSQLSKGVTFIFGCLSFGFGFVVEQMGNLLPATSSLVGSIVGPTLGIFVLGMFFPWSNTKGALTGMVSTLVVMLTFSVGVYIANNDKLLPDQKLELTTDRCPEFSNGTETTESSMYLMSSMDWKDNGDSVLIQILSVSYLWYPAMGTVLTVLIGIIASFYFSLWEDAEEKKFISSDLLSPPLYALWKRLFPKSMSRLVQSDEDLEIVNYFSSTVSSKNTSVYSTDSLEFKKEPLCDLEFKPADPIDRNTI
ncbi:unnamed protein product [Allacma fusca]|uniref:Sodium-coupled monocarboxylate transporter 1 n=2 Tax=Allacma fusca TaxID=39272 RepID=A0A8J2NSH1_9HEXA|nr:unnamed protein product [Allacma fusca]